MIKDLIFQINKLKESPVRLQIDERLSEFERKGEAGNNEWFSEMCFCLLTANSSAKKGIEIQKYMDRIDGFNSLELSELSKELRKLGYRFFRKRAEFIVAARIYSKNIKDLITSKKDEFEAREWLVKNVKGLGFKEASHFLRNVGYSNLAILDRHILRILKENKVIKEVPDSLSGKKYKKIEKKIARLAKETNLSPKEIDLYLWYLKKGEILK